MDGPESEQIMQKLSKDAVHYRSRPDKRRPENKCAHCKHFQGKFTCGIVQGLVSPQGICTYFVPG